MAIEIPFDWPERGWVEDTPLGHLETLITDAPSGLDPSRWYLASWESTREISSPSLPGQVRARTGLSVGTGKAVVKRDADDFPWKKRDVEALSGSRAQILLAPEGREEIPTGQFRVADVSGDLTTLGVAVDLDERQIEGTSQAPGVLGEQWQSAEQFEAGQGDPIWLIADLAEQMGYQPGPNVIPGAAGYSPLLDIPFNGVLTPRSPAGLDYSTTDTVGWGTSQGSVGLTTINDISVRADYGIEQLVPEVFTITADTDDGYLNIQLDDTETTGQITIELRTVTGDSTVSVFIGSTGSNGVANTNTNSGDLDITRNPDMPNRIQAEVTMGIASATGYNSASVRVRRRDGFWFGPYVHTMTNQLSRANTHNAEVTISRLGLGSTGFVSNFSIVDHDTNSATVRDTLLSTIGGSQGRIYLEPLIGTIRSPWLDPDLSVWTTMQRIIEAWQGALITDVYGDLRVLNRLSLSGVNDLQGEQIIDVGLRFEDVPWVMNYTDQADRLVVKYRPVQIQEADPTQTSLPTIYEFQDIIVARPGGNDAFFTLDYVYPVDLKLLPFVRKDSDDGIRHVWDAYRYNNGTGAHMAPGDDIGLRIDRVTSSTWKVFIDNRTASPFHMVDNTGTPWLKIRSSYWLDQTQEQTLELGLPSTEARNPLEIDLGHYVQNAEDAQAIADYVWARVNQRSWRATTVNSIPDYRLDLGDVVELRHARTGIKSNALVSRVHLAGEPGQVVQRLDLVLLPPTWEDFDEAWANAVGTGPGGLATWDDFDALWAAYTWDDFDRTPTATTVAEIEEGM